MSDRAKATQEGAIHDKKAPTSKHDREQQKAAEQLAKTKDKNLLTMTVRVYSPFRNYFEGQALSVSAENATGPFDILPHHHNFISLLSPCDLVIRTPDGNAQKISISGAMMHVKADQVIVFLDV